MKDNKSETKERILKEAISLFSNHGFSKTSVREIARAADVNVAAVNYHFSSKTGLFIALLERVMATFTQNIEENKTQQDSLEKLALHMWDLLGSQAEHLRIVFRVLFFEENEEIYNFLLDHCDPLDKPPGRFLWNYIRREYPNISEKEARLYIEPLASVIFHSALTSYSPFGRMVEKQPETNGLKIEDRKESISLLASMIEENLKKYK